MNSKKILIKENFEIIEKVTYKNNGPQNQSLKFKDYMTLPPSLGMVWNKSGETYILIKLKNFKTKS